MNSIVGDVVAFVAPVLQRQVRPSRSGRRPARGPGTFRSRGAVAPPASTIASKSRRSSSTETLTPTLRAGAEHHAFFLHDGETAVEEPLLHLEFGNAVAQQPADAIGALEHGDPVAGAVQLIGGRQAGRARADDGDALAGAHVGRTRRDPAFVERALDDRDLDRLDRDRVVVDAEHARALARRRAEPAGELGKVVRRVQAVDRRVPPIAIDEIVPVGNQVAERAALVTERDAAVHAARGLAFEHRLRVRQVHLLPVVDPLRDRPRRMLLALNFDEPCRFAHIDVRRIQRSKIIDAVTPVDGHPQLATSCVLMRLAIAYALATSSANSASVLRPPPASAPPARACSRAASP